ncbi:sensor histidine kinase [Paenibacillus spongiae]|uniref:histidine kinase n=1 Tax=Paenibacillus spongiae TaxID=2909671 RepID=A0ABY5SMI2_9BACL|nr:HAMP domain-containing sensor histidine kinase [Paenibacillus spongiae]UVI33433.1 HAMP domain-containing histidine kinase [Paenibacillus spongiae]
MTIRIGIVIFTWVLAFLVYRNNKNNPFSRWVSLVIFTAGCTTFATCLQLYLVTFLKIKVPLWHGLLSFLHILIAGSTYFCIYFFPYAVLMSCIVFSGMFHSIVINILKLVLLTPIIPLSLSNQVKIYPIIEYNFEFINIYTGIYVLSGCVLLISSALKKVHTEAVQKNKKITSYFYASMLLWICFSNYLNVKSLRIDESGFQLETIFLDINNVKNLFYTIVYILILSYIYFAAKYGLFGIKLKIERQQFDHTMKTISIGTNFLNHTIKNEIQKLNYLGNRTKDYVHADNKDLALQAIDSMFPVIEHMQNMVDRIKEKTDEITLKERPESLAFIIESALATIKPVFEEKQIELVTNYTCDVNLYCDKLHLSEVISNITMNAYEAVEANIGKLEIRLFKEKNKMVIEFNDNGCGIAQENVTKVLDPFYTTKKSPYSYGLGLSYCYSVIQKHQGSLTITSSGVNKGTKVTIELPDSKVVRKSRSILH